MLEWGLIIAWLLVTLALCAALPLLPAILEDRTDVLALLLGVAALLLIHAAFRGYRAGRKQQALVSVIAACVVLYGTSYDRVMPQLIDSGSAAASLGPSRAPSPVRKRS